MPLLPKGVLFSRQSAPCHCDLSNSDWFLASDLMNTLRTPRTLPSRSGSWSAASSCLVLQLEPGGTLYVVLQRPRGADPELHLFPDQATMPAEASQALVRGIVYLCCLCTKDVWASELYCARACMHAASLTCQWHSRAELLWVTPAR